jgi:hypothetical protein
LNIINYLLLIINYNNKFILFDIFEFVYKMSINYLTTYKKFEVQKEKQEKQKKQKKQKKHKNKPSPLVLTTQNNKRKYEDIINDSENEEQNMMHPLRNNDIYKKLMLLSKKEKIDKTIFTAKIVFAGIVSPTLPKGFKPIPDYDYEYESDYNFEEDYKNECEQGNLIMLAEVITNLEKL